MGLADYIDDGIAVFVIGVTGIGVMVGLKFPDWWITAFSLIIGYYFRERVERFRMKKG